MALAVVAGHCRGKRVRSSFETYAVQRENEGKWAPTLHSERKTGDPFSTNHTNHTNHMVIESGIRTEIRSILTLQSELEESPSTKTDEPPWSLNPCRFTRRRLTTEKSTIDNSDPRSNDIKILLYPKGRSIDLTPAIEQQQKTTKNTQKENRPSWRIPETISMRKFSTSPAISDWTYQM